jgi:hypothetical protein
MPILATKGFAGSPLLEVYVEAHLRETKLALAITARSVPAKSSATFFQL